MTGTSWQDSQCKKTAVIDRSASWRIIWQHFTRGGGGGVPEKSRASWCQASTRSDLSLVSRENLNQNVLEALGAAEDEPEILVKGQILA
jgi:hypothetical protein